LNKTTNICFRVSDLGADWYQIDLATSINIERRIHCPRMQVDYFLERKATIGTDYKESNWTKALRFQLCLGTRQRKSRRRN